MAMCCKVSTGVLVVCGVAHGGNSCNSVVRGSAVLNVVDRTPASLSLSYDKSRVYPSSGPLECQFTVSGYLSFP